MYSRQILSLILFYCSFIFIEMEKKAVKSFIKKHNGTEVSGREITASIVVQKEKDTVPTSVILVRRLHTNASEVKIKKHFPGCLSISRPREKGSDEFRP